MSENLIEVKNLCKYFPAGKKTYFESCGQCFPYYSQR